MTPPVAVIGQNVVIDFGSHEAAVAGVERVHVVPEAAARAATPKQPVDELQCGRCGDWLLPSELEGHLNSEGRYLS